jgi:hypothetical protein
MWSRLHNRFKIAKYDQLPTEKFPEAVEYLLKMDLRAELPATEERKPLPSARTWPNHDPHQPIPMSRLWDEFAGILSTVRKVEGVLFNRRLHVGRLRRGESPEQIRAEHLLRDVDDPVVRAGVKMIEAGMNCLYRAAETTESLISISRPWR